MTAALTLTRDEADRLDADGQVVLFRDGDGWCSCDSLPSTDVHGGHSHPPAEFTTAAKPCETCHGLGDIEGRNIASWDACHDCLDGKRRIAAVVPCEPVCSGCLRPRSNWDSACHCGWTINGQPPLTRQITVATVVVEWGPNLVGERIVLAGDSRFVVTGSDGNGLSEVPPDVDPAFFVGQYALCIRKASDEAG